MIALHDGHAMYGDAAIVKIWVTYPLRPDVLIYSNQFGFIFFCISPSARPDYEAFWKSFNILIASIARDKWKRLKTYKMMVRM